MFGFSLGQIGQGGVVVEFQRSGVCSGNWVEQISSHFKFSFKEGVEKVISWYVLIIKKAVTS